MIRRIRRLPSPALVISAIALIVAVGGGTFAIASSDNKKDKKIAKKIANQQIKKKAPNLKVKHAKKAKNAGHAANADTVDGQHASDFLGAANVRADGAASSTDIDDFTTGTYTDIITKAFTAPKNGFVFVVGTLSSEDDNSFPGSGDIFYRLALDGTGLTNDVFYHELTSTATSNRGQSGATSAVVPVSAGAHTFSLQAREAGTGDFILGRDLSLMFTPNGSASAVPFSAHPSAGGSNPQG